MNLLYSPITLKNVTLKNRIVMSPMCQYSAGDDGLVTDWHKVHYPTRAIGGVGLIIVEATAVHPVGRISNRDLGIWSNEHVEPLQELVKLIHANGAKAGIQLAHAGRKAQLDAIPIAPSAIPFSNDYQTPHQVSKEEIRDVVNQFVDAAARAKQAQFDIIEIHAAHGYLINQFLSPLANQREDEYGGALANRMRLLEEIITGVKGVWSGPLFVRFSAEEYADGGNHIDDYVSIASHVKNLGVDLIDVSSGGVVPYPIKDFPGYQTGFAEKIKRGAGIATAAVGKITTHEQAEEILAKGQADVICLGRELLRNPYWALQSHSAQDTETQVPVQYRRAY